MKHLFYFCLLSILLLSSCNQQDNEFTFVQMADTQLGFENYQKDVNSFNRAVKQINELNPDFVIICGDLVNVPTDSTYSDFLSIKKKFNMPCYCVPGNHDVLRIPNASSLAYYRKTIGKDYYSFSHKGYSFVITNTQLWNDTIANESKKHNSWFKNTIAEATKNNHPIFIIGHSPIYTNSPDEKPAYYNLPQPEREEILTIIEKNNVVGYLSGHAHMRIIKNYKGIPMVTCVTTSENFDNNPLGFRVWNVSSDSINHTFIPLNK